MGWCSMKPRDREVLEAIAESARLADEYARDEGPEWLADSRTVDLDILREVVTDDLPILRAAVGSTLSDANEHD